METIYCVTDQRFARYGRVLHGIPVQQLVKEAGRIEKNFSGVNTSERWRHLRRQKISERYRSGMAVG